MKTRNGNKGFSLESLILNNDTLGVLSYIYYLDISNTNLKNKWWSTEQKMKAKSGGSTFWHHLNDAPDEFITKLSKHAKLSLNSTDSDKQNVLHIVYKSDLHNTSDFLHSYFIDKKWWMDRLTEKDEWGVTPIFYIKSNEFEILLKEFDDIEWWKTKLTETDMYGNTTIFSINLDSFLFWFNIIDDINWWKNNMSTKTDTNETAVTYIIMDWNASELSTLINNNINDVEWWKLKLKENYIYFGPTTSETEWIENVDKVVVFTDYIIDQDWWKDILTFKSKLGATALHPLVQNTMTDILEIFLKKVNDKNWWNDVLSKETRFRHKSATPLLTMIKENPEFKKIWKYL